MSAHGLTAHGVRAADPTNGADFDVVTLGYEDRYLRRKVVETAGGEKVLIDLPEAVSLKAGDRLMLKDGRSVRVAALQEPVALISPGTGTLAELAWHIGNRHTPCAVEDGCLVIKPDHVLEAMLEGLGARIEHRNRPFEPLGGAYGHGRTHGHGHADHAHDDPNAHIPQRHAPHHHHD